MTHPDQHSSCRRSVAVLSAAVALSASLLGIWFYLAPSSLLKLLAPAPRLERVVLAGSGASDTVIDLQGGWFNEGKPSEIVIRSQERRGGWDVPQRITIRNGRLRGAIRIFGMGRNGEAPRVRESSVSEGHAERAQAAAPREIVLENLQIEAAHRIPLYLGPGVTGVTVTECTFAGWTVSTAVYLDAESAGNTIENCTFDVRAAREVIAVDGSARNIIESNRFLRASFGGIYLYRNSVLIYKRAPIWFRCFATQLHRLRRSFRSCRVARRFYAWCLRVLLHSHPPAVKHRRKAPSRSRVSRFWTLMITIGLFGVAI